MKYQFLATILTTSAIATATTTSLAQPERANTANITCNLQATTPAIMATVSEQNDSKEVTMLSFLPQYFSPEAATETCQTTAKTLQSLYNDGRMKYLSSSTLNGQPTVCAVETRGFVCDSNNPQTQILFSFQPDVNPSEALYEMLGSQFKEESSSQPHSTRTVSRIYSDFQPRSWWPF
jgi:Circadian oscillating protein COP23